MLFKVTYDKEIHILKSTNAKTLAQLRTLIPKVFKILPKNFYLTYLDEDADEITLASEADFSILLGTQAKSAKIVVREKAENFYDATQQIDIEQQGKEIQALLNKECAISEASEIKSNVIHEKSMDESIEEKLKSILPEIISKIKTEVQEELSNQSKMMEQPKKEEKPEIPKVVHENYTCDGCQMHNIVGARYKCSVCNNFDLCQKCEATSDHPHPFLKIKHPRQAPLKMFVVLNDEEDSIQINGQKRPMNGLSNLIEQGLNIYQQFMNHGGMFNSNMSSPQPPQKQEQQKEEKKEEKKEQLAKEKVEPKAEPKVETKPQPTIFQRKAEEVKKPVEKVEPLAEMKKEAPKKKEDETNIIVNANYLTNLLGIDFTQAYVFSQQYPTLSPEEMVEAYFCFGRK